MRRIAIVVASLGALFLQSLDAAGGRLVPVTLRSPSLEQNVLGDSADAKIEIYLPASYERDPQRRYPVLYLLHGFLGDTTDFTTPVFQGFTLATAMDDLARNGTEFIVVVPSGRNRLGGSYWVNSSATGNWEDYLIRELIPYVDRTYRTLAQPSSRGIAGHSMGGLAAIALPMRHGRLFGAAYAMSPCCLAWKEDFGPSNPAWKVVADAKSIDELTARAVRGDYEPLAVASVAAAFSPNPARRPLPFDLPYGGVTNDDVLRLWQSKQILTRVEASAANLKTLRGLAFDAGFSDQFRHIPITTRELSETLSAHGVAHIYEAYSGDHRDHLGERLRSRVLPFFARTLSFAVESTAVAVPDTSFPATIDPAKRYLIYVHPRIIEVTGVEKAEMPPYGRFEYYEILRALGAAGFTVISEVRTSDRPYRPVADQVAKQVRQLLGAGVPGRNITIVGFSKGGVIALMAAATVGKSDVNVAAMATCSRNVKPEQRAEFLATRFAGRILLIDDTKDAVAEPCRLPVGQQLQLEQGRGYGEFFAPRPEWIQPIVDWARLIP